MWKCDVWRYKRGDVVIFSDKITGVVRLDCIPSVAWWLIKKGKLSARYMKTATDMYQLHTGHKKYDQDLTQGGAWELASSDEKRKKFGSRKTHICWEWRKADCQNNSEVHQPFCVSFYVSSAAKTDKIISLLVNILWFCSSNHSLGPFSI